MPYGEVVDQGGVVDPTLKVYGTANVRVVDLSIVPLHIAAHTQGKQCIHVSLITYGIDVAMLATVYVIAEQGKFAIFVRRMRGLLTEAVVSCRYHQGELHSLNC